MNSFKSALAVVLFILINSIVSTKIEPRANFKQPVKKQCHEYTSSNTEWTIQGTNVQLKEGAAGDLPSWQDSLDNNSWSYQAVLYNGVPALELHSRLVAHPMSIFTVETTAGSKSYTLNLNDVCSISLLTFGKEGMINNIFVKGVHHY